MTTLATDNALSGRDRLALLAGFVLAALTLLIAPNGFGGGHFDDQRYLEAARAWLTHPPLVGDTHWEMRHTLTLPLAAWFGLFGESLAPFRVLPALAWLGLLGISMAALARFASVAAALIFAGLLATTQLFHQFGTRFYPEVFELFFAAASLWSFYAGTRAQRPRAWYIAAGLAASLAMLTRETSFYLPIAYGGLLVLARPERRRQMLWIAAGALPLLLAEALWLWSATGDPLYRAHVALNHVAVPTDQMEGMVYRGQSGVLFNPDLASRWKDVGTFDVHWSVNPLLNLFADIRYGLLFWLAGGLWLLARSRGAKATLPLGAILAIGLFAFAFATYALMVPQRTRYYGALAYAAAVIAAVLADHALLAVGRRRLFAALAAVQLVLGLILVGTLRRDQTLADVAVPLVAASREPVHMDGAILARLRFPLETQAAAHKARLGPAPPGAVELVVAPGTAGQEAPACCWEIIAEASATPSAIVRIGQALGLASRSRRSDTRVALVRRIEAGSRRDAAE